MYLFYIIWSKIFAIHARADTACSFNQAQVTSVRAGEAHLRACSAAAFCINLRFRVSLFRAAPCARSGTGARTARTRASRHFVSMSAGAEGVGLQQECQCVSHHSLSPIAAAASPDHFNLIIQKSQSILL